MTEQNLDRLFESARTADVETSATEVMGWVAGASAAAATIGFAAKLKLVLTKKMIMMMTGTFGVIAAAVVVTAGVVGTINPASQPAAAIATSYQADLFKEETGNTLILEQDTPRVEPTAPAEIYTPGFDPAPFTGSLEGLHFLPLPPLTLFFTDVPDAPLYTDALDPEFFASTPDPMLIIDLPDRPLLPGIPDARLLTGIEGTPLFYLAPAPSTWSFDVDDTTKNRQKELEILPFKRLELNGVCDVVIAQGDEYKLIVSSDDNNQVMANNDGDLLTITTGGNSACVEGEESKRLKEKRKDQDKNREEEDKDGITLYITVKDLSELNMNGIGNVSVSNLKTGALEVYFSGVGNIDLGLDCDKLELESSGIGNLIVTGKSREVSINYSGVGDIEAYSLMAQNLSAQCSGIGNVFLYAENEIKIDGSGVGDISYKGNPKNETLNFTGIGSIRSR